MNIKKIKKAFIEIEKLKKTLRNTLIKKKALDKIKKERS